MLTIPRHQRHVGCLAGSVRWCQLRFQLGNAPFKARDLLSKLPDDFVVFRANRGFSGRQGKCKKRNDQNDDCLTHVVVSLQCRIRNGNWRSEVALTANRFLDRVLHKQDATDHWGTANGLIIQYRLDRRLQCIRLFADSRPLV